MNVNMYLSCMMICNHNNDESRQSMAFEYYESNEFNLEYILKIVKMSDDLFVWRNLFKTRKYCLFVIAFHKHTNMNVLGLKYF